MVSFGEVFSGLALADSKIRLIDINNDGIQEIIHIGDPNPEGLGVDLKVNVYEQSGGSLIGPLDISDQIESLKRKEPLILEILMAIAILILLLQDLRLRL